MVMKTREDFHAEFEARLARLYKITRDGYQPPEVERRRLEGFINAGVFIGITSNAEISAIIARVHQEIFGVSVQQKRQQQSGVWPESEVDYAWYDIPTFER